MIVDAPKHRLIVSHTGSNAVAFIDTSSGELERQLYVGAAHGIAIDERGGRYYIGTSGADKGVVVIDRSTVQVSNRIATPGPVDALIFDPTRRTLFADEDNGNSIWVIPAAKARVVDTIRTPEDSDKAEYDPVTDKIYQNFTTINSTIVFDLATFRKVATWSTLPATKPHGLAIDARHRRLFVAGTNGKLAVINMSSGHLVSSLDIVRHADQIALDVRRSRLYCASGDGHLSVVDEHGGNASLIANVTVPRGAHTIALDQTTGAVWISYGTDRDDYVMKLTPRP